MVKFNEIEAPKEKCNSPKCPFHGTLSVRGRIFVGKVISDKMTNTVSVEWERIVKVPKYERYMTKRSRVKAHNPSCINAKLGDEVIIGECRPLSKTKKFVVLQIIKRAEK